MIYGNHDKNVDGTGIFQSTQAYKVLKTEYGLIVLFHHPILDWYGMHYGSVHLHGHIHSTGDYNEHNLTKEFGGEFSVGHTPRNASLGYRIYDVGVDANAFYPVSLEFIAKRFGLDNTQRG